MIDETYAGIKPKSNFKQDPETGISNIESASAGSSCPASPAAAVSKRLNWNSWQFGENGSWHEAGTDIAVTCETPNICT